MANFKSGALIRIKSGLRTGEIGRIIGISSERQAIYQVEFPQDSAITFFFEDELEAAERMFCPECIKQGLGNQLSNPQHDAEGWAQKCPVHGKLYLWGWHDPCSVSLSELL